MRITLSGSTGFLGTRLQQHLLAAGHELRLLLRQPVTGLPPGVEAFLWNPPRLDAPPEAIAGSDAIIHLSGASVNQRWTPETKALLRSSRLDTTRSLVQSLSTLSARPPIFLCASAIGIYGDRGDETLTEASSPGPGFLSGLTLEWEKEANLARALGIRVNCLRTGVVLGKEGGALASMLPVFRLGFGGKLGSGQQWMSWIHVDDWVNAVTFLLQPDLPAGPFNLTAPEPARNAAFTQTLGKVLRRPAFFPVPEFALRLVLGEMSTIILASQRVLPASLQSAGFHFQHPALESALRSLL